MTVHQQLQQDIFIRQHLQDTIIVPNTHSSGCTRHIILHHSTVIDCTTYSSEAHLPYRPEEAHARHTPKVCALNIISQLLTVSKRASVHG